MGGRKPGFDQAATISKMSAIAATTASSIKPAMKEPMAMARPPGLGSGAALMRRSEAMAQLIAAIGAITGINKPANALTSAQEAAMSVVLA